jgi:hypothetical protein
MCSDFVLSYCKLFGLYLLKDDSEKKVSIVTRNTFYGGATGTPTFLDITGKIDRTRGHAIDYNRFDFRYAMLKYADSEGKLIAEYNKDNSVPYGAFRIDINNEFSSVEKKLLEGNIFRNAVVSSDVSNYYQDRDPQIYKDNKELPYFKDEDNGKEDSKFSLFFLGDFKQPSYPFIITDDTDEMYSQGYMWTNTNWIASSYYQSLKRNTTVDGKNYSLNIGKPNALYGTDETREEGTIYSRFWKNYIEDVYNSNTKIIKVNAILSNTDMKDILRKFIIIDNVAWVIDNISAYNPLKLSTCTLTLVKVQDIENYTSGQKY